MTQLNTRQMKYVIALAENKRLSIVADKLYVSQSSVSKQVHAVEEEIGFPLFKRARHGVEVTPEGKLMVDAFIKCRQCLSDALNEIFLPVKADNRLVIGFMEGFDSKRELLASVKTLCRRFEDMDISVGSYGFSEFQDMINERKADMFLCPEECIDRKHFNTYFLWEAPRVLMVPAGHPVAKRGGYDGYDFSNDKFMMIDVGPTNRRATIEKLKNNFNIQESQITMFDDLATFSANIETRDVITVIPMPYRYIGDSRFWFAPVDPEIWKPFRIVAAWHGDNNKQALLELIKILRQFFPGGTIQNGGKGDD